MIHGAIWENRRAVPALKNELIPSSALTTSSLSDDPRVLCLPQTEYGHHCWAPTMSAPCSEDKHKLVSS